MRKFLRYLRVVFCASCGLACVLLIVLSVRSYWWLDMVDVGIGQKRMALLTAQGNMRLEMHSASDPTWKWKSRISGQGQSIGINPQDPDGTSFSRWFFHISASK